MDNSSSTNAAVALKCLWNVFTCGKVGKKIVLNLSLWLPFKNNFTTFATNSQSFAFGELRVVGLYSMGFTENAEREGVELLERFHAYSL